MNKDFQWALDFIKRILYNNSNYTGRIELNFYQGNIANINKLESIQPKSKKRLDKIK